MTLASKVCIVTGGGQGIGEAICRAYARAGAMVVVADMEAAAAERTASAITAHGGTAMAVVMNVTQGDTIKSMAQAARRAFGGIDVLVNNAGARIIKGFMQHSEGDWNAMLQINLTGPFLCGQAVVPDMIERGGGKIINLASIASFVGRPNRCAYVAAKSGLLGLTRAMAMDLSTKNIRVNAIAPGMIASPFNQSFAEASDTGPAWADENRRGRWGQPDDIAGAAVFLASDDSDFVTGTEIKVEGGWLSTRTRSGEQTMWD